MNKNLISFSILFFGLCIVLSSWIYSNTLKYISNEQRIAAAEQPNQELNRFELIVVNENNIIIYDKQNGDTWRKFIQSGEGPTEWEKQSLTN
ncbi:hypothetical protein A8F94_15070 [Bacillus sp. FJAT-27225]|uniref:hypothetical protein n=1 Tax=Bacillus sp. FJAT-27225 TaxID=1743144 RepID=UPI00080C21C0|nr:hypothetical protein [Bacillus sp. FJAT-27225]OCA84050.1 hypothetical protein A8F94_15070 [Bacillus sp. FJAT-27225]